MLLISVSLFWQEPKGQKQTKQYRDAGTGKYVTKQNADNNKSTTVSETKKHK